MDNEKIGRFICELRKSKQMTQKDLATQLNITDKAVSQWERGNRLKSVQGICAMVFSLLLFVGIVVCAICDIAITGAFTWSLFPISSIIFAWLVFFSVIMYGTKGIFGTMIAISVLIVPFLYVLNNLIKSNDLILPIGIRMAAISVAFLWCVFVLFKIMKTRRLFATAISLVVSIPVYILINYSLSKLISEPIIDVWDIISISIIAIVAIAFYILDYMAMKNGSN